MLEVLFVVGFIVLVVGSYLIRIRLSRLANRKFWSRKQYKEQQELVATKWQFRAVTSAEQIKAQLKITVSNATKPATLIGGLYILGEGEGFINYRCGNKLQTVFDATLIFYRVGDNEIGAELHIPQWLEIDGVCESVDDIKKFINLVIQAFLVVDNNCCITEISPTGSKIVSGQDVSMELKEERQTMGSPPPQPTSVQTYSEPTHFAQRPIAEANQPYVQNISPPPILKQFCGDCGNRFEQGSIFCGDCGAKL